MSDIHIIAKPTFMPEQSQTGKFVFAYTIRIENNGAQAAQLISREWKIVDAKDQVQEVRGIGVVGEQPRIEPGEAYSYTSGVIMETETGTMEGSYTMKHDDGSQFAASIPMFALVPRKLMH